MGRKGMVRTNENWLQGWTDLLQDGKVTERFFRHTERNPDRRFDSLSLYLLVGNIFIQ